MLYIDSEISYIEFLCKTESAVVLLLDLCDTMNLNNVSNFFILRMESIFRMDHFNSRCHSQIFAVFSIN